MSCDPAASETNEAASAGGLVFLKTLNQQSSSGRAVWQDSVEVALDLAAEVARGVALGLIVFGAFVFVLAAGLAWSGQ